MDVWLTTCRKTVPKCSHCQEPIKLGEVMVVGKLWRTSNKDGEARRWLKTLHWHAQRGEDRVCCWLIAGLDYLSTHPTTETRGRKLLQLTKKEKEARLKLVRQRARLVQKIKLLMLIPLEEQSPKDIADMIKVGSQIIELREKIAPLGGVPPSWE